jgi:hypothetical protein
MSTVRMTPFDTVGTWIAGVAIAAACVAGQWAVSTFLPEPSSRVGALRRLDAYVLTGPVFVGCVWLLGS